MRPGWFNCPGAVLWYNAHMKRRGVFNASVRAAIGIIFFIGIGAGVRAFFEELPWTRTETYVATVATPVAVPESTPAAVPEASPPAPPPAPPRAPVVTLSRGSIEQADTFAVSVSGAPSAAAITATWGDRMYDLAPIGDRWIGLLGADAKKAPGNYPLTVQIGTSTITRQVAVAKRNFPVTVLAVTPELEEAGHTPLAIQANVAAENARLNSALIYTPRAYFSKPFANPLDRMSIVGAYGNIRKSGSVELQHLGLDLDATEGTPVYAVNDGVVNLAEDFVNYGKTIIVDHGLGIFSYYLHLRDINVHVGDRVTRGRIIAKSGNTGYSIAPHLHFSMRIRNASVDPLRFIETANGTLR